MWEKTILSDDKIMESAQVPPEDYGFPFWWLRANQRVAKAQAKVSYEAGIKDFIDHIMNDSQDYDYVGEGKKLLGDDVFWRFYEWTQKLGDISKKQGIEEVAEWLHCWHKDVETMIEWQEQLKEWSGYE